MLMIIKLENFPDFEMRVFAWIIIQIACALLSTFIGKWDCSEMGDRQTGGTQLDLGSFA